MNDIRAQIRRQIELEDEMRSLGVSRYNSRQLPWRSEAGSMDEEANLPPGRKLMTTAIPAVTEAIEAFLAEACSGKAGRRHAAADFLLLSSPDEIAYLALRVMVNASRGATTLQGAAIGVTDAIIENLEYKAFREINKVGYKGYMKAQEARGYSRQRKAAVKKMFLNEGVELQAVSQTEKVSIGTKCIELIVEATGFFSIERRSRAKGFTYMVVTTETLQGWLDNQHARCGLLDPMTMPMVVRPRRWRSPTYGGYLTKRHGNRLIKQRNRAYLDEVKNAELQPVYDAVNHIQDSPWKINTRVLAVMEEVWNGGGTLGGLPTREDTPVPAKPDDIDTNEEAKQEWKKRAAEVYARNAELLSARLSMHQRLWIARKFAPEGEIFYPHELDFRGRVYPMVSGGPTPQGDDSSKALLEFAQGMPLGLDGFRWLNIHVANLFGVDKVPFSDRCAWVTENLDAIIDSGTNPLDGDRFWTTADSPYMALAACIELAEAWQLADPTQYVSSLPIALDGSCSGLQHFSAMLRDTKGGAAVNLLPSERPQDVYMEVAKMGEEIAQAVVSGARTILPPDRETDRETTPEATLAAWWVGKISRAMAKRPTMTFCYSSTRFGMQGMILGTLKALDRERKERGLEPYLGGTYIEGRAEGERSYEGAVWLSHVLFNSISLTVVAAATAMDWLREAAKVAAEADLPLWWTTPLGLPILQEYKSQKGKRVEAHWAGRRVDLMVNVDEEKIDRRAQANGVAPNFVHSLDACHLQAVALRAKEMGIRHLAVIHDSFGTHAANTTALSQALRETFVEQYSGDVLGGFYRELKEQLGEELAAQLPEPPKAGDLDLQAILKSDYIFA
jgi:DNA-directed RNA polymerase